MKQRDRSASALRWAEENRFLGYDGELCTIAYLRTVLDMGLESANCSSSNATGCRGARLVQYQAGFIPISCGYSGCTCPAFANLVSFTRHYLYPASPEK